MAERAGFDEVERATVDFDKAVAALAMRHRRRRLLPPENLDRLEGLFLAHSDTLTLNNYNCEGAKGRIRARKEQNILF